MLLLQQFLFLVVASPQSSLVVQMVLAREGKTSQWRQTSERSTVKEKKGACKEQGAENVSRD